MSARDMIGALRRGLDRAGFETDKLMRYNRVKTEAVRLNDEIRRQTGLFGERALELYEQGLIADEKLAEIVRQITQLRRSALAKEEEAAVIQAEAWPEAEQADASPQQPTAGPSAEQSAEEVNAAPADLYPAESESAPTYCQNCGNTMRPGALFCARCGSPAQ